MDLKYSLLSVLHGIFSNYLYLILPHASISNVSCNSFCSGVFYLYFSGRSKDRNMQLYNLTLLVDTRYLGSYVSDIVIPG